MPTFIISFLALLCLVGMPAYSSSEDLIVNSDNQDLNYKDKTLHFSGKVTVQQGNISIFADELFVETTDEGNSEKLIAKGSPALFKQQGEAEQNISSEAIEIIYLVEQQILTLNGKALFIQGSSQVSSDTIEFDLKAQRVKAEGNKNQEGRVTTRLKTKQ
ncbi:MAG: lipopolysaccharide transport periplasmic protein LptA [Gammaproteobacteria bacterium]|nr:lipopolysaccharide transport periplasmic protein LptA [Gammaproteobacteria bacterium]